MMPRRFHYSTSPFRSSQLAFIVVAAMSPAAGLLTMLDWSDIQNAREFADLFRDENGSWDTEALIMVLMLGLVGVTTFANSRAQLLVSPSHFHIRIPRFAQLGFSDLTTGEHRIPIEAIRELELKPADEPKQLLQALQKSRLEVVTDNRTYRFQPFNFVIHNGKDHRLSLRDAFSKSGERLKPLLQSAPLVKSLSDSTGKPITINEPEYFILPSRKYNLLSHKGMVGLLVALAGIGGYAGLDYVLLTDYLVVGPLPYWPFVSAGLIAATLGVYLSKGAPPVERVGVSALLVVATLLATGPALKRYTLWASEEPVTVAYQVQSTGLFVHPDYPTIDQRDSKIDEYWDTVGEGQHYDFRLYEPALEFWLVDMGPVYEKSRAFYKAENQGAPE